MDNVEIQQMDFGETILYAISLRLLQRQIFGVESTLEVRYGLQSRHEKIWHPANGF